MKGKCSSCGKHISIKAEICPHCGVGVTKKSQKVFKLLIIALYVSGVLFMARSTYIFFSVIPKIDMQILSLEHYLNGMQNNHAYFQALDIKAYNSYCTLHTLYCVPFENERYKRLHEQFESLQVANYQEIRKKQIEIFTPPDTFKIMSDTIAKFREIDSLVKRRLDISLNNMNENIAIVNDLYEDKNHENKKATLFQIIGLFINQLGIIFQIFASRKG